MVGGGGGFERRHYCPQRYESNCVSMVYSTFWSRACDRAINSGIDNLTAKSHASFSLLVAAFVLPALISGWFFVKWWLLTDDAKAKVWRLYGHFTCIMCLASMLGCVSWSSNLKSSIDYLPVILSNYSDDSASPDLEEIFIRAPAMRWRGVFHIFYSFEVMCVIIVKLMYCPPPPPSFYMTCRPHIPLITASLHLSSQR